MLPTPRLIIAALAAFLVAAAPAQAAPGPPLNLAVADLIADEGVFDPQFTWSPVSGARGYEIEVNSTSYWAPGSKVCCDTISSSLKVTTLGVAYSPPEVLANNNEYYWRVRAVDANGAAGPWRAGPPFAKDFGNTPSVPQLRLADLSLTELPTGSTVSTPIVLWDAAPGASSYRVVVTPFTDGLCDWSAPTSTRWEKQTATTAWTPLGWGRATNADPLTRGITPASDSLTRLDIGQAYCVRVSPIDRASTTTGPVIESAWTYLPANNSPAFTWAGPAPTGPCNPCSPVAGDYLSPAGNSTVARMPVLTWNPVPGAQSYFVVVAKDASFTNIEDYAFTRVTAYAPRTGTTTKGYADESSHYFWAVLPAALESGQGVSIDPVESSPQTFRKQAVPPGLLGPADSALLSSAATVFHWTPVDGARRYRVQVSEDPTFVNVIREQGSVQTGVTTDSTAYTSSTDYPTGTTLYWRVQAEAEDGTSGFVGLRWSAVGSFKRTVAAGSGSAVVDKRFRLTATGTPVRNTYRTVTIVVRNRANQAPVASARVRVSGAGLKAVTKTTNSLGKVTFRIRPTAYPGTVTFTTTKAGFTKATLRKTVRTR